MARWLVRGLAVACLVAVAVVADGGVAGAAPPYQVLSVDSQGPLGGDSTEVAASADGHLVAFTQQTGAGCDASALWQRDRQAAPATTTRIDTGSHPAVSAAGTKVAYVTCAGDVQVRSAGTTIKVDWKKAGGPDTVKALVMSPSGAHLAFTAGSGTGRASALFVAASDGSAAVPVSSVPAGDLGSIALGDKDLYLLVGGKPYHTTVTQPAPVTPAGNAPGGTVTGVATSADGGVVAFVTGDGVSWTPAGAASATIPGAVDASVAPDGSAVSVAISDGSIKTYTTASPPALLSTAVPVANGGFSAPVATNGGRQVVFLAKPGSAAGTSSSNEQVIALGPGLSTSDVDFGTVGLGTTTTKAVTFTNDGTVAVTPISVDSSNPTEFSIVTAGTTCVAGRPLEVGQNCVVQVALTPAAGGARTGEIKLTRQDTGWDSTPATSKLTATAVNGELSADPTSLAFGSVTVGSSAAAQTFTVTNTGPLPTTIGTLLVSGGQAPEFPLAGGTCAGATLQPTDGCTVSVSFKPGGVGGRSASLDVAGSTGAAVSVSLSGTGTNPAPPPRPALSAAPATVEFGEVVLGAATSPQTVTVHNTGNVANTPSVQLSGTDAPDFVIASNGCSGRSLAAGASCSFSVGFTPTAAGSRSATVAVTGSGGSSASVHLSGTGKLNPMLGATPAVVVPGQVVTVTGTDFAPGQTVSLAWDVGGGTIDVVADGTGSFTTGVVTPRALGNGTRTLTVVAPAEATTARAAVLVQEAGGAQNPTSPAFRNSPAQPATS